MKKRSAFYRIGKDVLIVILGVIIIWTGLRVAFGTENPFYVVSSGSMEPELNVFDVLVVQGNEPFEDIKKGDIIVFDRPSGHDRVIVHRVVDIINDDPYTIKTKGDANPASIPGTDFPITDEEYIGKVISIIPQIGFVTRILTPPINYIIIAVIVGIMIFRQVSKSRKKPDTVLFGDQPSTSDLEVDKDQSLTSDAFSVQDNEYTKTDEMGRDLDSKSSEKKDD